MTDPTPEQTAVARAYVNANTTLDTSALLAAVQAARANAYATGLLTGADQTGATITAGLGDFHAPTSPADWAAYWDTWTPGDTPAADLQTSGGLADLLASAQVDIKGITGSVLDGLGNTLAQGVANGDSVDTIAGSLMDYLGSPSRA